MSALFRKNRSEPNSAEEWAKIAERRSSPPVVRLRAGLLLRYLTATGVRESDTFVRDSTTWAKFEHAVLPELENFTFFDAARQGNVPAPAVLADAMFHLWTATELGLDTEGRPTTIGVISELARYLCAMYQTTSVSRHTKRNWLGLNPSR